MYDFEHKKGKFNTNGLVDSLNICFVLYYTIELIMKLISRGLWGYQNALITDISNIIDVFVVVSGNK